MPARSFGTSPRAALVVFVLTLTRLGAVDARALGGELRCVFEVCRETTPIPSLADLALPERERPPLPAPKKTTFTLDVAFGRDALVCEEGNGAPRPETISYDFLARRVTTIDPGARTFRDTSLYAVVAFRVNELINRMTMAAGLAASEITRPEKDRLPHEAVSRYTGRFTSETLFSLRLPAGPPPPKEAPHLQAPVVLALSRQQGEGWDFVHDGRPVVEYVPSDRRVPEDLRRSLRHFLAYRCSIHPEVRDKILAGGFVPRSLTFRSIDIGRLVEESVSLTLKVARDGDAGAKPIRVGPPRGYAPVVDPGRPLDAVVRKLEERLAKVPRPDRAQLDRFVDEAMKRGSYLDAYLAWCEYTAETGDPAADLGQAIRNTRSPQLAPFITPVANPNAAAAERQLKALDAIDRKGLTKGHMIDALCGTTLTLLRRPEEAEARFLKALDANPMLVSAYVQLGTNRFQSFFTDDAWQAFDAARRIDPASPYLNELKALEKRFAADFADEF